jgi:hypothetical protein
VTGRYLVAAGRIRSDLHNIERTVERARKAMELSSSEGAGSLLVDSAALNLHDFYAGLERLFEVVASSVDESVPVGPDWHRDLLSQLGVEVPGIRPIVLSENTVRILDDYLRFRHVVRNVYAFQLDAGRVGRLVDSVAEAFSLVKSDLLAFADFLQAVGSDS